MKFLRLLLFLTLAVASCATTAPGPATPGAHGRVGALPFSFSETMSLGTTGTSTAQQVAAEDQLGFAVRTTGTASGTWLIQYSNDGLNWDTYNPTGMTLPPAASGSPQTFGITINFYEFGWVRIQFTNTGGTGTATIQTQMRAN